MKNILLKAILIFTFGAVAVSGWGQVYSPADNSSEVSTSATLTITFPYNFQYLYSVTPRYIKICESNGTVVMQIAFGANAGATTVTGGSYSPTTNATPFPTTTSLVLTPSNLECGKSYYVTIDNGIIRSRAGISPIVYFTGISSISTWNFSCVSCLPVAPTLNSVTPSFDAVDVDVIGGLYLYADFSDLISINASGNLSLYKSSDNSLVKQYTSLSTELSCVDNYIEIVDPSLILSNYQDYYILISSDFIYSSNNGLYYSGISDPIEWTFRTLATPLTSDPSDRDPLDDATDVAINQTLSIIFSEPIEFTGSGLIYIRDLTDVNNFGIYDYQSPELSISGSTLSINPTGSFANTTEYEVTIDADLVASSATGATNSEISGGAWTFTTVAPPAPVTTVTPADASSNISIDTDIKINFDQSVRYIDDTAISSDISKLIASITGSDNHTLASSDYLAEVNSTNDTVTLTLLTQLHENVTYTVVVNAVENTSNSAQSGTYTSKFKTATSAKWLGSSSDWNTSGNWSTASVPDNTTSVVIQKAGSYDPTITNGTLADVNSMTINADASLIINGSLRVRNALTLKSSASKNASLLNNGTLTVNSSNVKIQQVVTNPAWDYYISSPVNGVTPAKIGFIGSVYERLTNSWGTVGSNTTLTNAKGYVGIPTSATTLVYKGTINNGSYSFTGQRTTTPNNFGWSLAGNPYPCSIDWTSSSLTKTNLTNGFWVYLNDTQRWGTYGGNAGLGVNVDPLAPSLIPSGHAFYVQVLQGQTTGSLSIAPGSRVNNAVSYLKTAQATAANPVLRLEGVNGSLTDELAVTFIDGAADAFDVYDSQKQTSSNPDLLQVFSLAGTTRCAINSFYPNDFANSFTIPLGYTASVSGTYNLYLKSIDGFADNIVASLEDTQKGLIQEIHAGDSYSFTTTAKTDLTRFKIHLSATVSTNVDTDKDEVSKVLTYVSDHVLYVKVSGSENMTYELIDANGQLVDGGDLTPGTYNRIVSAKNGVFILKVITNQGVCCKKVLIN